MAVDLWSPASAFKHQTDCLTKEASNWETIDWPKAEREVKRLQRRIAQAVRLTIEQTDWLGRAGLERSLSRVSGNYHARFLGEKDS